MTQASPQLLRHRPEPIRIRLSDVILLDFEQLVRDLLHVPRSCRAEMLR